MTDKKIKVSQLPRVGSDVVVDSDILHVLAKDGGSFFKGSTVDVGDFSHILLNRDRDVEFGNVNVSESLTVTQSSMLNDVTASTLSVTGNTDVDGNLEVSGDVVVNGSLTANELIVTEVSRSILYESGSTAFGDTLDDIHTRTGSLNVTGSISLNNRNVEFRAVEYYHVTSSTTSFDLENVPLYLYNVTLHPVGAGSMVNSQSLTTTNGDVTGMSIVPDFEMAGQKTVVISGSNLSNILYGSNELYIVEYSYQG